VVVTPRLRHRIDPAVDQTLTDAVATAPPDGR